MIRPGNWLPGCHPQAEGQPLTPVGLRLPSARRPTPDYSLAGGATGFSELMGT